MLQIWEHQDLLLFLSQPEDILIEGQGINQWVGKGFLLCTGLLAEAEASETVLVYHLSFLGKRYDFCGWHMRDRPPMDNVR